MTDEIENKVIACFRKVKNLDDLEIRMDHRLFEDFDMDSLDHIEFIMAIEETFDIYVSDNDAEGIKTVSDAVALVKERKS